MNTNARMEPRARQDGLALVIVLSMIVLLTVVVVAYFSRVMAARQTANDSSNGGKTDQLARSALDVIVNDFKQEIVNGSTATTISGVTTYYPKDDANGKPTRAYMVPVRSGTADTIPNLIRRSVRSDAVAVPGVASRAAAVNSADDAAMNGRTVSLSRWNKHYLIPQANAGTNKPDPVAAFNAPDWVLVTRNGPAVQTVIGTGDTALNNAAPANGNFVVGRYAYAVYDEGGLLDANVAGFPSGATPAQIGRKSSLGFSDLPMALAAASPPVAFSQTLGMDKLVGWRQYATTQPDNVFPSSTFARNFQSDAAPALRYFDAIQANNAGSSAAGNVIWNGRTNQSFVSRQELLSFQQTLQQATPGAFPASALQYLGTFTRELNAPSWGPTQNAADLGGSATDTNKRPSNYKDIRGLETVAGTIPLQPSYNRLLPTVRFAKGGTITSYCVDGTPFTYGVNAGDPLVRRRFPLGRLAWIGANGPRADKGGTTENIQKCFGLTWVPATGTWSYDASLTSQYAAPPTAYGDISQVRYAIKTLGEVAKEASPREPNFFELLGAGILSGSLAMPAHDRSMAQTGAANGHFAAAYSFNVSADTWPDYHIFRIGAAIIAQAQTPDADTGRCYPCSITYARNGVSVQLSGIDNLPYLNLLNMLPGKDPAPLPDPSKAGVMVDVVFGLWNPNQAQDPSSSVRTRPPVRLCVQGEVMLRNEYGSYAYESVKSPVNGTRYTGTTCNIGFGQPDDTARIELLSDTADQGVNGFTDPHVVGPSDLAQTIDGGTYVGKQWANLPSIQGQAYIGYRLPDYIYDPTLTYNSTRGPSAGGTYLSSDWIWLQCVYNSNFAYPFNAWMEYKTPGGVWVPYNYLGGYDRLSAWTKSGGAFTAYMTAIPSGSTPTAKPQIMDVPSGLSDGSYYTRYPQVSIDPRASRFHFAQGQTPLSANAANVYNDWPKYLRTSIWSSATELTKGSGGPVAGIPVLGRSAFQNPPSAFYPAGYTYGSIMSWTPLGLARNSLSTYEKVNAPDATVLPAYTDPDGVQRIADSGLYNYNPSNAATNGWRGNPYALSTDRTSDVAGEAATDRPLIIHRPFNNVGELGYVSRDYPWRTLDFYTANSADAGLLDLFTASANPEPLCAGRINLNTGNTVALAAALGGGVPNLLANRAATAPKMLSIATKLAALTRPANPAANGGPFIGKDEIATRFVPTLSVPPANAVYAAPTAAPADFDSTDDQNIKPRREAITRAFSEIGQTRTWNLLVDVVVQSGRYSTRATKLSQFNVEGERHYWLHVAIDRFTGEVIDQQLEAVTE